MKTILTAFILTALAAMPARAHELNSIVTHGKAVVIELTHPDDSAFSFERYEIFRENEDTPFQVGQTDGRGRIVFIPDRGGEWRIRAFSEDGHGLDLRVDVSAEDLDVETSGAASGRLSRIIVGAAIVFGVFGIISLFLRRKHA